MKPIHKRFPTCQEGWEGINEYLFLQEKKLTAKGQGRSGNQTIVYNLNIFMDKAWVDPKFDFANMFGYRIQKWTSLVNNYVDLNYLDLVKTDIRLREAKKQRAYNVTMHFRNHHDSGKACLISATFSRRLNWDVPIITFHARASEVTKRLLIDFLLVQRIAEYVYGKDATVSVEFITPLAYIVAEAFTMYHTHRDLKKLAGSNLKMDKLEPMQKKVLDTLEKFSTIDVESLSYKVHRRSVRQLQRDKDGVPLSGTYQLLAGNLDLIPKGTVYPDHIVTDAQRKKYRKKSR